MKAKDIKALSTADLVAEYNMLTGKNIKKFSSREAGERQVLKAMEQSGKIEQEAQQESQPQDKVDKRSEGIAESWKKPEVAAARAKRDHVVVDGHGEFRSVLDAFNKLHLPVSQHIKFRMELKAAGEAVYTNGDVEYKFKVIKQEQLL